LHKINTGILTRWLFILDSTKVKQTGKTVTYEIRKPDGTVADTGVMTELGSTALYYTTWTPDEAGWWIFVIACANPVANDMRGYLVEAGLEKDTVNLLEHGTHGLPALKILIAALQTDLDNPSQFKADVSALALEATLTAIKGSGWSTETLKAIYDLISGLNDLADSDVWSYSTRTLTDPNSYKADVSALALEATLGTPEGEDMSSDIAAIKGVVDDISSIVQDATFGLSALDAELEDIRQKATSPSWNQDTDSLEAIREAIDALENLSLATIEGSIVLAMKAHLVHGTGDIIPPDNKGIWDYLPNLDTAISALNDLAQSDILSDATPFAGGNIASIKTETDQLPNWRFDDKLATTPTVDAEASASEESLTAGSVTPTFPTGATRQRAYVVAMLHAANKSEATHKIGLTLQIQKNAGGYGDVVDLTANPPISLISVDGACANFAIVCDVTATVDTSAVQYDFKWLVDSDNAGAVNYTSNFVLVIIYSM